MTRSSTLRKAEAPAHLSITPSILYVGTPVVLITTLNVDGSTNISPMSSAWALGDRVVLGCTASGHGIENLLLRRECVLNFPSAEQWREVESLARATGRREVPPSKAAIGYEYVADKFALAGLSRIASETVAPPRIAECPFAVRGRARRGAPLERIGR
jgi:flavin reductase (DIM6/NTAB) family NADH-FMN oxidoreductase RutF